MTKTSVHLFISSLQNESRLVKEAGTILTQTDIESVIAIGLWEPGLKDSENHSDGIRFERIATSLRKLQQKGRLKTPSFIRKLIAAWGIAEYQYQAARKCLASQPSSIACHNLNTLPLGALLKLITKSKLVYTPHELETERTGLGSGAKRVSKIVERMFIQFPDSVIVVSDPIANWYTEAYELSNVYCVPNMPVNPRTESHEPSLKRPLRKELNLVDSDLLFIYQGMLSASRGIDDLLQTFSDLPREKNMHLVFMGYGEAEDRIKNMARENPRIHFREAVPVSEIIEYTASCDVGLFFLTNQLSLSYRYCLPNKYFEYVVSGLPILISDNLEYLATEVTSNDLGWVVPTNLVKLQDFLVGLSPQEIQAARKNVAKNAASYGWHQNHKKLRRAYAI